MEKAKDALQRSKKFSGTKRTRNEVEQQDLSENSQSPSPAKRIKTSEVAEEAKATNLEEKLKRLSQRKNMVQSGSAEQKRPFSFVSVLQKAKTNLETEK